MQGIRVSATCPACAFTYQRDFPNTEVENAGILSIVREALNRHSRGRSADHRIDKVTVAPLLVPV